MRKLLVMFPCVEASAFGSGQVSSIYELKWHEIELILDFTLNGYFLNIALLFVDIKRNFAVHLFSSSLKYIM